MNTEPAPPQSPSLPALRALLRARFPRAHTTTTSHPPPTPVTGLAALDALHPPVAALTEVVCPRLGSGGALLLHQLLHHAALHDQPLALIDGRNSFDPLSLSTPDATPGRLLWLRCHNAPQCLRAADLLLRDGNLNLLLIDLQLNTPADLAKVPDSSWHRLRALLRDSRAHCFILTPRRTVPRAELRVQLSCPLQIDALDLSRTELLARLHIQTLLHHHARTSATG